MKAKPFLRWAGSKKQIIPHLEKYWSNNFTTYFEPFVGSGQLYFSTKSKRSLISDINEDLIGTYLSIKENPKEVHYILSKLGLATKEKYYQLRNLDKKRLNQFEKASIFIYLNRYCFNGLYRTNNKGNFNVPYCGTNTAKTPSYDELLLCSNKLAKTKILHGDFETIVQKYAKPNDFVYLDPPYAISNKRVFQQYNPTSFGLMDISRLTNLLDYLNKKKITFLLSYAYTKDTVEIFGKWHRKRIITQRNIAGFAKDRKKAAELLVTNIDIDG